ncbi:MAG: hypothetical protein GY769_17715, partial [bacterium]|nr:hypothetical protein [bacterium]
DDAQALQRRQHGGALHRAAVVGVQHDAVGIQIVALAGLLEELRGIYLAGT